MDRRTDPTRLPGRVGHVLLGSRELRRPRLARLRCGTTKTRRPSGPPWTGPHRTVVGRIGRQQGMGSRGRADQRGAPTTAGPRAVPSGSRPIHYLPGIHWRVRHTERKPARHRSAGPGPTMRALGPARSITGAVAPGARWETQQEPRPRGSPPVARRRRVDHDERPRPSPQRPAERRKRPANLAAGVAGGQFSFRCWSS